MSVGRQTPSSDSGKRWAAVSYGPGGRVRRHRKSHAQERGGPAGASAERHIDADRARLSLSHGRVRCCHSGAPFVPKSELETPCR